MDHPRTPSQGGTGPAHGLPHFSGPWVRPLSPQFPAGCPGFLPFCSRPPGAHLWFCFFATADGYDSWNPLWPSSRPGPHRPWLPRFPSQTPSIFGDPHAGADSSRRASPGEPILAANHHRAPIPPNPGLAFLWVPPPERSGPHSTAGSRPGPKAWPRPLAHFKGPVTSENAAPGPRKVSFGQD